MWNIIYICPIEEKVTSLPVTQSEFGDLDKKTSFQELSASYLSTFFYSLYHNQVNGRTNPMLERRGSSGQEHAPFQSFSEVNFGQDPWQLPIKNNAMMFSSSIA